MARPQQFDRDTVLKAAMLQFWRHGYASTSMTQLLQVTRLTPSSFYNAFGSKKDLFLKTIAHYNERVVGARNRRHLNADDPVKAIENYFCSSFELAPEGEIHGCMLANAAAEFGAAEAQISQAVQAGFRQIEIAFKQRIEDGKARRTIRGDLDADAAALHLLSCFQGLTIIGRLNQNKPQLRSITQSALQALA